MCYIPIYSYPILHDVATSWLHAGLASATGPADAGGSGQDQGKLQDAVLYADTESNGTYQTALVPEVTALVPKVAALVPEVAALVPAVAALVPEVAALVPESASLQGDAANNELPAPSDALSGSTLPQQGMLKLFMFVSPRHTALPLTGYMLSWHCAYMTSLANVCRCT